MPTISLCMIVKNEENDLPRCLNSVAGLFDQIVIVDTGSTDNTRTIAESYGAEVHKFVWVEDFALARNFSFSKAKSDYIMWLDADDEIKPEDKVKILNLKHNMRSDIYYMLYNYAPGKDDIPTITVHLPRIVRNSSDARWQWPIHEAIIIPPSWRQERTDIVITHRKSFANRVKDSTRNLSILRNAVKTYPYSSRMWFYLAKEVYGDCLFDECLSALVEFFKLPDAWHDDIMYAYYMKATSLMYKLKKQDVIDVCTQAIIKDPKWAEFYAIMGQIYYDEQRWNEAIPWFEIAARMPKNTSCGIVLHEYYTWIPQDRLCKCYGEVGRIRESYEANEKALAYCPNDQRMLYNREYLRDVLYYGRNADRPIRLSLGSGGKFTQSYRCTDLYPTPNTEELIDITNIPYKDSTIHALQSEHSLEHVSHNEAEQAIKEWARTLRYCGYLSLKIPDLEVCCTKFITASDYKDDTMRWSEREWYKYTIYGIQKSQNGEDDAGQYHKTGFTTKSISDLLEKNKFKILDIHTYDGYGTPSISVSAIQIDDAKLKIVWFIPAMNEDSVVLRIRILNLHKWFVDHGYNSEIIEVNSPDALNRSILANVCVFMSFGPVEQILIDKLQRKGVKCVMDHCEDLYDRPYQTECFQAVDAIACCSTVLTDKTMHLGSAITMFDPCEELQ